MNSTRQSGNRTNRTSTISGINNQANSFTANDWLGSDTYDTNGNTTASGTSTYQYDVMNHLTNANGGSVVMAYDGDGDRVSKKAGGVTTYYLLDDKNPSGYVQVLEEWTSTGTPALSRVYNYGLALISQRQASSGTVSYYYGTDGHGSTRFLLDGSGGITDTYTYDAYGVLIANTGTTPNSYLYCGQQYDSDLGLYYNRARYLNPDTGRFWTMDTYEGDNEDPLSLHKYLYGADNPVMGTDPSGNKTVVVVTDADNKGSGDQTAADKAASHLQKAGWSVTDVEAGNFVNIKDSFDGVIMSGHGDETQSAAITVDVLESMCKQTGSKLDVGIALSCHGIDFISKVTRDGYTTPTALVLGYWGYSLNSPGRTYRVGKIIDKWVANPTYTSVSLGNIGTDMGGEGGALAKKVGIGILNVLDAIDLDGIMD